MNKQIEIKSNKNGFEAGNIKWTEGINSVVTVNGKKIKGVHAEFVNYIDGKVENIERTDPRGWHFYNDFFMRMTFAEFSEKYGK